MNRADIDAWISARKALDAARARALGWNPIDPPTTYEFVSMAQLADIERCVGASSRVTGDGSAAIRSLYYGGCLFQAPAGRAD